MPAVGHLQLYRGTTEQNASYTGVEGELTVDINKGTIRVHDGHSVGGTEIARMSDITGGGGNVYTGILPISVNSQNEISVLVSADIGNALALGTDNGLYISLDCGEL